MKYSIAERIFTFLGPNSLRPAAVFSVNDLSDGECEVLRASVQRHLEALNRSLGHGPFTFKLGPDASTDLASFIVLKTELAKNLRELEASRGLPNDTWRWELGLIHDTAHAHAETIRSLRGHANKDEASADRSDVAAPRTSPASDSLTAERQTSTRFQVEDEDAGGRLILFDSAGAQKWGPRSEFDGYSGIVEEFEWAYSDYLFRLSTGRFIRIRYKSHCEANLPFDPSLKRFSNEEAAEWLLFGGFQLPEDIAHLAQEHLFTEVPPPPPPATDPGEFDFGWLESEPSAPAAKTAVDASEEMRRTYRDPDNYWRNVWLYEQRKAGKTNPQILRELEQVAAARNFAPLETDGGLRTPIESIAIYHGWPVLKGKPGAPKRRN